jgi:hypothetical protein
MSTDGTISGNNTPDPGNEGTYFNWQLAGQDGVGNYSVINWQFGWRFATYSCRGLRQGWTFIDGNYVYYNYNGGDGVHNYNGGHDHRPALEIASGSVTIYHNVDGTRQFYASMGMTGYSANTSNGEGTWDLPTIPRDPGAPSTPVISDLKQKSVVVSWTPNPADGLPNTEYTIGYGTNSSTPDTTTTSSTLSKTITGLTPGTKYYFWVKATNSVGTGPYSAPSNATTIAGARVNVAGVWKQAIPYVRDGGTWKVARPWTKSLGEWKEDI